MCGRYRLSRHKEIVEQYFEAEGEGVEWSPRYNVAPSQPVPVVRQDPREPKRELSLMRWGLIPSWAKDASIGYKTINARSETAATKAAFAEPLKRRRCLIPADAFYEWKKLGRAKQPYCFTMADETLFAFAGLWDRWRDPAGQIVETCSILTTTPNRLVAQVHDRMPVILPRDDYDAWLDPGLTAAAAVLDFLKPFDSALMKCFPVSARVSAVANDDEECCEPVSMHPTATLFEVD